MAKEVQQILDMDGFLWVNIMFRRFPFRAMIVIGSKNDGDYSPRQLKATFRNHPELAEYYLGDGKFDMQQIRQWLKVHLSDWENIPKVKASSSGDSPSMPQNE